MKLTVLGSSSAGNSYLLQGENETLIVECGVRVNEVKRALGYDFSQVAGVVVSHAHNDHAGYAKELVKLGIPLLALQPTLEAKGIAENHFAKAVKPGRGYRLGRFEIIPYALEHDVPCVGYHIAHPEMGRLLFVTDTSVMRYRFEGLNHILIEANYDDASLDENIESGVMPGVMRPRLLKSHLSIESTQAILRAQDTSRLREVVLIHLSANNSNSALFEGKIKASVGVPVYIARKGFEMELVKP